MECETIERWDSFQNPIFKPKRKFNTLDRAIKEAKFVNSQDHIIHKVVAYKCRKCQQYHIGRNGKELEEKERTKSKKSRNV